MRREMQVGSQKKRSQELQFFPPVAGIIPCVLTILQEIIPGLYLGPYSAAMKTKVKLKQKFCCHIAHLSVRWILHSVF